MASVTTGFTPPAFAPAPLGWNIISTNPLIADPEVWPMVCASNIPFATEDLSYNLADGTQVGPAWPTKTTAQLPDSGVLVVACIVNADVFPAPSDNVNYPDRPLPLQLAQADFRAVWEGQPGGNVPELLLLARTNQRYVELRTYFGSQTPAARLAKAAQALVDVLVVPAFP